MDAVGLQSYIRSGIDAGRAVRALGRRRARLGAVRAAPVLARLLPARGRRRAQPALLERVNAGGEMFISQAVLNGRYVLRLAIGQHAHDRGRRRAGVGRAATRGGRAVIPRPGRFRSPSVAIAAGGTAVAAIAPTPRPIPSPRRRRRTSARRHRRIRSAASRHAADRFMSPNGDVEIHNDGWQTDAYTWAGPLGRSPQVSLDDDRSATAARSRSTARAASFRSASACRDRSCTCSTPTRWPRSATFSLPPRQSVPEQPVFQDFTGGGYFYLDNHDRVVTATTTRHIYVIAETPGRAGFHAARTTTTSAACCTSSEEITSALPDPARAAVVRGQDRRRRRDSRT